MDISISAHPNTMLDVIFSTAFFAAFDIAAIVIGALYKDLDTSCVTPLVKFNAALWLLIGGSVVLVFKFILAYLVRRQIKVSNEMAIEITRLFIACGLFMFAWLVVGIVILASTTEACSSKSFSVYVMTIIYIIALLFGVSYKVVKTKKGNKFQSPSVA